MSTLTLTHVPFHGSTIAAVPEGDDILVPIRPVCENIGIDYSAQLQRLKRQPWATVVNRPTVGADGKIRDMAMISRRTFTMWLGNVDTFRVKSDEARALLVRYQCEAADVLDRYFHQGGAVNPQATEHQLNAIIFQSRARMELLQAAQGLIHPDHLEARARVVLAAGLGEGAVLDPATRPLYVQDYLAEKNLSRARLKSIGGVFGKRAKAAYIERHGREPQRYPLNLGNGQTRNVLAYTEADRALLDHVWSTYYSEGIAA